MLLGTCEKHTADHGNPRDVPPHTHVPEDPDQPDTERVQQTVERQDPDEHTE